MHSHLEVIMPPTDDVAMAVESILSPFSEHDGEHKGTHTFWDWYVIGGRWSGAKILARLGKNKVQDFKNELVRRRVTISGLVAGKEELSPAEQIPAIDALWREWFPGFGKKCLLFQHAGEEHPADICKLAALPERLTANHVIIAAPNYENKLAAQHMLRDEIWNGVTLQKTTWDGTIASALAEYAEILKGLQHEYAIALTPRPDWLVVTVDYHS